MPERQLTVAPYGHVLTNVGVWSADGRWIVYDTRSAVDGAVFDGTRIERVEAATGRVEVLYEAANGACCGVATCSATDERVVFILGPERPTAEWHYGPARRQGVVVDPRRPGLVIPLDARDLAPPFTPGALRGGTHVHTFSGDGRLVASTYEDAVLDSLASAGPPPPHERNLRSLAVSVPGRPVRVPASHPRNHDGSAFTVVVAQLTDEPRPGSDEICRACEEGWVGTQGYVRPDGTRQRYAIAFQGTVTSASGVRVTEVFIVDLPDDPAGLETPGAMPLAGTPTTRPAPPATVRQRRLTFTTQRRHPGLAGPRHWIRSSPDGRLLAFLARDDAGTVQLFAVSPCGGPPRQLTRDAQGIQSAFTFSPDGERLACVIAGHVCTVDVDDGAIRPLTQPVPGSPPRPEACVFSPDGRTVAFARVMPGPRGHRAQVCVVDA